MTVGAIDTTAFRCGPSDAPAAVEILVGAFIDDPAWSWIIRDPARRPAGLRIVWQAFVASALRYSTLWMTEAATAAAVWIPPDGEELTEGQAAEVTSKLEDLLGADAAHAFAAMEEFDKAHPHHEPHFTLSLLGTDVAHRGRGYGLQLLAASLVTVDDADLPAYLEASNPANVALYERYGFELFGGFDLPDGGPRVATMWRGRGSERR